MGQAQVIALGEVRASQQRQVVRQQLHEHLDRWLDDVEADLPASTPTLAQVSQTIWKRRQALTAGIAQRLLEHGHQDEQRRESVPCATCQRRLKARQVRCRTVTTMIGEIDVKRPYFYCGACRQGRSPLDEALG